MQTTDTHTQVSLIYAQKRHKQRTKLIQLKTLHCRKTVNSNRPKDVQGFVQEDSTVNCAELKTEPLTGGMWPPKTK